MEQNIKDKLLNFITTYNNDPIPFVDDYLMSETYMQPIEEPSSTALDNCKASLIPLNYFKDEEELESVLSKDSDLISIYIDKYSNSPVYFNNLLLDEADMDTFKEHKYLPCLLALVRGATYASFEVRGPITFAFWDISIYKRYLRTRESKLTTSIEDVGLYGTASILHRPLPCKDPSLKGGVLARGDIAYLLVVCATDSPIHDLILALPNQEVEILSTFGDAQSQIELQKYIGEVQDSTKPYHDVYQPLRPSNLEGASDFLCEVSYKTGDNLTCFVNDHRETIIHIKDQIFNTSTDIQQVLDGHENTVILFEECTFNNLDLTVIWTKSLLRFVNCVFNSCNLDIQYNPTGAVAQVLDSIFEYSSYENTFTNCSRSPWDDDQYKKYTPSPNLFPVTIFLDTRDKVTNFIRSQIMKTFQKSIEFPMWCD